MEVDVEIFSFNASSEDMQLRSRSVSSDEDDAVACSEREGGRCGESCTGKVGVLGHELMVAVLLEWIVVGAVRFSTEPRVLECVGMGEVCAMTRFELVIPECAVDVGVSEDEGSERGHAASLSESSRVFMHS